MNFEYSEWAELFPENRSRAAYQKAMRNLTPLDWSVIESSQGDLLDLLVDRVAADTGSAVILALALLFRDRPDADRAGQDFLRIVMIRVSPKRAKTILVSLEGAWKTVRKQPLHRSPGMLAVEVSRTIRRLLLGPIDRYERLALHELQSLIEPHR